VTHRSPAIVAQKYAVNRVHAHPKVRVLHALFTTLDYSFAQVDCLYDETHNQTDLGNRHSAPIKRNFGFKM